MQLVIQLLAAAMEGTVLFLVLFSAWPFGSVHKYFQWVLLVGVGLLLVLWAVRALLERRVLWVACPIVIGLAVLCLLGMVQVIPLSTAWIGRLSPNTAALQEFLLPTPREMADAGLDPGLSGSRTLSFDAGATRACLLQLVAILALFATVRNNLRSPGCFRRLAWVCVANGVLLAFVGIGQMVSSPPSVVLWSFHTDGAVFGPFICRNHFAYFANLCLGLTVGLLLGTRYFLTGTRGTRRTHRGADVRFRGMLRDPRVLWLAVCAAILFAGVLACLSRGGFFGLIVGCGVAAALLFSRGATPRWAVSAGAIALAVLLVTWIGFDRVSRRWEHLMADATGESRVTVWHRSLALVGRFPLIGTGLGTFGVAEPQTREPGDPPTLVWDHAHNDFLELWVEGGTLQLLTALVVIVLVVRAGIRAFWRQSDNAMGRLAVGALVGFVAVAVQSFVDFGLHVPAVAVLAAVVAAMLANLAEARRTEPVSHETPAVAPPVATPQPARAPLFAAAQAAALLTVALFLVSEGHRAEQAERYRLAAWRSLDTRQIDYLRSAVVLAPEHADLRVALADALVHDAERSVQHAPVLVALCSTPAAGWPGAIAMPAIAGNVPAALLQQDPAIHEARLQLVQAQWRCPLSSAVQERLLKLAVRNREDPSGALKRLMRLSPSDPAIWLAAGRHAMIRNDREEACRCWRNAMLSGDTYLKDIVRAVPGKLSAGELLDKVLPPNPALIVAAADTLAETAPDEAEQERFLRAALAVLRKRNDKRQAAEYLLEARIHARLNDSRAAHAAYQTALARNPGSTRWRFEFCEFLYRTHKYSEARAELLVLLSQEAGHPGAKVLQRRVLRDIAKNN